MPSRKRVGSDSAGGLPVLGFRVVGGVEAPDSVEPMLTLRIRRPGEYRVRIVTAEELRRLLATDSVGDWKESNGFLFWVEPVRFYED